MAGQDATAQEAYETLAKRYIARNPKSQALHESATLCLPGGNTRTVLYYPPFPLSISHAHSSFLTSADGHTYTDLMGEYTAGLYGHSHPIITSTLHATLSSGLNFGAHHANEAHLASLIKARFPSMQLLRFTNSGTESTLMAISIAKVYSQRKFGTQERRRVLVFKGAYHGAIFTFAGGEPSASSAPWGEYVFATYNDLASVYAVLRAPENVGKVAAIIVEGGMIGSGGAIPSKRGFLEGLRKAADESGAVLIFDEVMTSRLYRGGGAQSMLPQSCWPDLTTLGKYLGGGSSFGCFGGNAEIMSLLDPRRPDAIAHAGTFNNNVLTMAAGIAGLTQIFTPERAESLHATGENLRSRLNEIGRGTLMKVTGSGSIMCFHWTKTPVEGILSPADFADEDTTLSSLLHLFLLERGYYMAKRGFIALSLELTEEQLDGFAKAVEAFVQKSRHLLELPQMAAKL